MRTMFTHDQIIEKNQDFFLKILKLGPYSQVTVTGFLDVNTGEIHVMKNNYEHLDWLKSRFEWVNTEHEAHLEHVGDAEQEFIDDLDPGEHPGWHRFEIWKSGEEIDFYHETLKRCAKDHGVFRIGYFRNCLEIGPVHSPQKLPEAELFKNLADTLEMKLRISK